MKQMIKPGDIVVVPAYLNNGEKCLATVIAVYNRFVLLEKKNKMKLTIQIGEFHRTNGVIKATSDELNEMEEDILMNI